MKPKIALVGKGNVGGALARGFEHAGYEVKVAGKDPGQARPFTARREGPERVLESARVRKDEFDAPSGR